MIRAISGFFRREEGQDLADYCLLTALVALVAAGILFRVSGGLENLWTIGQHGLNSANSVVQGNGVTGASNH
jgi:Flp pilus assembly pilin Flp